MTNFFRNKIRLFLYCLSFLLLLPNFLPFHLIAIPTYGLLNENFDPALANRLQSVKSIIALADSIAKQTNTPQQSIGYGNILSDIVGKRFYHGYSHYAINENWLAAFAGCLVWEDLSAIVLPNDILKYPSAACSQQSIVIMECFKQIGVPYRKVGFPHHYALEGQFNGKWFYFDTNKEPDFSTIQRKSIDELSNEGLLFSIYKNSLDSAAFKWAMGEYKIENIYNNNAAPNAALFHKLTDLLSHFAWIVPLLLCFIIRGRKKYSLQ
jgi:hypothetical protein